VRLRQVLVNLVGNAAKFTHKGEIRVGVSLLSDTKGRQRLEFIVSDSGTGVAPEALKNLTQPFKQADRSTARKYGGTGLGLAVSQKLVKLMGGTLTLKSELGKGTQARFQCDFSASSASPQGPEATIERPILAAPQ
ncbi:ATP-binding protein, partial [Burkholderia sp. SIMBA_013]